MKKLNDLSDRYFSAVNIEVKDVTRNGKSLFVPELIDIICPPVVSGDSHEIDGIYQKEEELVNIS